LLYHLEPSMMQGTQFMPLPARSLIKLGLIAEAAKPVRAGMRCHSTTVLDVVISQPDDLTLLEVMVAAGTGRGRASGCLRLTAGSECGCGRTE
jgi:hypothetical protein